MLRRLSIVHPRPWAQLSRPRTCVSLGVKKDNHDSEGKGSGGSEEKSSGSSNWKLDNNKWWLLACFAFLGGPTCLDLLRTYIYTPHQIRSSITQLLRSTLEKPDFANTFVREEVRVLAEKLNNYLDDFNPNRRNVFVVVGGPKAAGKTSAIELAFGGKDGVVFIETTLEGNSPQTGDIFKNSLNAKYGKNHPLSDDANAILEQAFKQSMEKDGQPFLIYWKIQTKNLQLADLKNVAKIAAGMGRQMTYDHAGRNIPVIIETSNPTLGALIPKVHQTCDNWYLDHMNYNDLVKTFDCDPEAKPFKERLGGNAKYKEHLREYYSHFGGNMRGLKQEFLRPLDGVKDPAEFRKEFTKEISRIFKQNIVLWNLAKLDSDFELDLCRKIAKAGPQGLADFSVDQLEAIAIIERRSLDIFRNHRNTYRLHHMAYVRHLLQGETEEETTAAMVTHGWLPKAGDS